MKARVCCVVLILLGLSLSMAAGGETVPSTPGFAQSVVAKAISFMPADLKEKLAAAEKNISTAAKPAKAASEPMYFVDKEKGTGPSALAEQFRLVRKGLGEKPTYSALAPALGRLAGVVIALSQPYHTDEAASKSPAHAAFEKDLDAKSASLKAEFDGFQKVDNPSDFATDLAKQANELLKKLSAPESEEAAGVASAVFALASNSLTDVWWSLLASPTGGSSQDGTPTGNFIGNKRSLKFHLPTCRYMPAEKNRVYFQTREEAISEGYVPCKVCKP
jgi:hypothetical protein